MTPRNADWFARQIEDENLRASYLCLELDHWGYAHAMAWVYKIHTACRLCSHSFAKPSISIYGPVGAVTTDECLSMMKAGAIWMPRDQPETLGKDPVTILQETLGKARPPKKEVNALSDEEFEAMLKDAAADVATIGDF